MTEKLEADQRDNSSEGHQAVTADAGATPSAVLGWRISTFVQKEGARIVVNYNDDNNRESSFPVNTPMTIGQLIEDYDRTWPDDAVSGWLAEHDRAVRVAALEPVWAEIRASEVVGDYLSLPARISAAIQEAAVVS